MGLDLMLTASGVRKPDKQLWTTAMPSMPSFPALTGGGSTMFSVENINVNVAKLIDDQDYDEVVDQVYDRLEESISRRSPVGGIRVR